MDESTPAADAALAPFSITPVMCTDGRGPDCTRLRLGDPHLTTATPEAGKLFACTAGNPSASGSITARITWIDQASANADLDACHGHSHGSIGYHYHATMGSPYTIGCYRGTPRKARMWRYAPAQDAC